ncbi:hypothetical protein HYV88_04440 [Candidatus Woesearchaeota archaeon]|nr:hypothetical protein [Candidatus Woesearchaeota archaeon]
MENLVDLLVSIGGIVGLILAIVSDELRFFAIIGMAVAFIVVYIDINVASLRKHILQINLNKSEINKLNERINIYERLSKVEADLRLIKR